MERRVLILGGFGLLGVASAAVFLRPDQKPVADKGSPREAGRPTVVFVGHEL
ncbi:MAG: hypothetical protein K9G48_08325 [Reyranella sp.]|nr:hypothetical protein [Reyranella sp.]